MIRFCDKEVVCITVEMLNRQEIMSYFFRGHTDDIIVVLNDSGQYQGNLTYHRTLKNQDVNEAIDTRYVTLNEQIWKNGRDFFRKYESIMGESLLLPVVNRDGELLCFAYEDEEANREIRMLRELEECTEAISFSDIYPEYDCVTIDGCNELAYYFAQYLIKRNIPVNVKGELWKNFEGQWNTCAALDYRNLYIYAEGTEQIKENLKYRQLHSVSPEFECIDEIYEANLNQNIIKDTTGNWQELIEKLKGEKEVVILGIDEHSQDVYDLFMFHGVEVCCFAANGRTRQRLFGKEIIGKKEAMIQYKHPIFIECSEQHSTWGGKGCDAYDYYGFERNKQFYMIQDYIEIPKNNLMNAIAENKIVLVGDIYLCHRLYRYFKSNGKNHIGYLEINEQRQAHNFEMRNWSSKEVTKEDCCFLVIPEQASRGMKKIEKIKEEYRQRLQKMQIWNYTTYFSRQEAFLYVEAEKIKSIESKLTPKAIVGGNISGYSGNIFIRDVLYCHPEIRFMDYSFFNNNLFLFCVRLAELKASEISSTFWSLYEKEAGAESIVRDFPQKELFQKELKRCLMDGEEFTSQELFIIFHMAYAKMCGKEIKQIKDIVLYWEPHHISRHFVAKLYMWLGSKEIKGYMLKMSRNRYSALGSAIKTQRGVGNEYIGNGNFSSELCTPFEEVVFDGNKWENVTIRFEDLKIKPLEEYSGLCKKMKLCWYDNLVENIRLNNDDRFAKGFDLKPVYNHYEEYFTVYDRMKISLIQSRYQKMYGYPYMNVHDFSRKELQSMFLKDFRCEKELLRTYSEDMKLDYYMYRNRLVSEKLWKLRQQERVELLESNHQ